MKKLMIMLLVTICILFGGVAPAMASKIYAATALTGGAAGALDAIADASLADKDGAVVFVQNGYVYYYVYDSSSTASESSPDVITPDDVSGDGRWILTDAYIPSGTYEAAGITASDISDKNAGTDITADLEEETHASEHAVSAADTVFPADPGADRYLMWDDDPGALAWAEVSGGASTAADVSVSTTNFDGHLANDTTSNTVQKCLDLLDDIVGGFSNLTSFVSQTAWRMFYSNADGDVTELAFGDSGKVLTSGGASAAPTWETISIPAATLVTEAEGIASNDNDTTVPSSAAVKDYLDLNYYTQQLFLTAAGGWPSSTSGCAVAEQTETTTNKVNFWGMRFSPTTTQYCEWGFVMPSHYDGGTITATFYWMHPATTTNFGVTWGLQGFCLANDGSMESAFGTAQEVSDTGGTTDDDYISSATSAITITNAAASTYIQLRAYRDPDDASDTLAVDAKLLGVMVKYNE
jgi:hypothetical protein